MGCLQQPRNESRPTCPVLVWSVTTNKRRCAILRRLSCLSAAALAFVTPIRALLAAVTTLLLGASAAAAARR